ncbi:hypothetical protein Y032_0088g2194 [Ancylostoma ceylanicum]|uniref:Uncharacterized protein n=1 Tax=Ancylostoma ceylanicum TaxID=53326 RepID=A0A016TP49_9BILA|nr:hypothetical protein Y032_0088g2194 [Ancylostoma ceylanicum]
MGLLDCRLYPAYWVQTKAHILAGGCIRGDYGPRIINKSLVHFEEEFLIVSDSGVSLRDKSANEHHVASG